MILSDQQIREAVGKKTIVIEPFNETCLQPASYDVHLDHEFRMFKQVKGAMIDPRKPVTELMEKVILGADECFILEPKCFALALVQEKTGVDNKHVGRLEGKSSLARLGLVIHTTAGFLDPGNCLKMTLELFNASPLPIKLYPGMKIAQIAFEELGSACEKPYGSVGLNNKYVGSMEIQESLMYLNFQPRKE